MRLAPLLIALVLVSGCGGEHSIVAGDQPTQSVASVGVTAPTASVFVDSSTQLTAVARDASGNEIAGRSVAWSVSAPTVASVTSAGVVKGLSPGSVTVTATIDGTAGGVTLVVAALPTSLRLSTSNMRVGEVVIIGVHGVTVPATGASGTVGSTAVVAQRFDDTTLTMVVPPVVPQQHLLQLTVAGKSFSATIQVGAAPAVANATVYLTDALAQTDSVIAALERSLAAPLITATRADTAAVRRDIVAMRAALATARQKIAAATPADRAAAAAFFAANAEALGLVPTSAVAYRTSLSSAALGLAQGSGACLSQSGQPLFTSEECEAELMRFTDDKRARLVLLAGILLAAGNAAATSGVTLGWGALVAVASVAIVYREITQIQDDTFSRFIQPVIAKLEDFLPSFAVVPGTLAIARGTLARQAAPEVFVSGLPRPVVVMGTYRSLNASDTNVPGLADVVGAARSIEQMLNEMRSYMALGPIAPLIPTISAQTVTAPIPAEFLSTGAVGLAGATVSDKVTLARADWLVTITNVPQGADHATTLSVGYSPPGLPKQQMTQAILLQPARYAVAAVQATPPTLSLSKGATAQLTAVVSDSSGTTLTSAQLVGRLPQWSSSRAGVATVEVGSGALTAVDTGSATITVTSDGKSGSSAVTVTGVVVASVSVTLGANALPIGGTTQATAITRAADNSVLTGRAITWSSSAPAVATVDPSSGAVLARSGGTTVIIATSEGKAGGATLAVTAPVASVAVTMPSSVAVGSTVQASAILRAADNSVLSGRVIVWSSSNPAIATVGSSSGQVTGVSTGTATITATSEGKSGSASIQALSVASVTITSGTGAIIVGTPVQATARVLAANGTVLTGLPITWSTGNPAVATVGSSSGIVSGVAVGSTTLTAAIAGVQSVGGLYVETPFLCPAFSTTFPGSWVLKWTFANGTPWEDDALAIAANGTWTQTTRTAYPSGLTTPVSTETGTWACAGNYLTLHFNRGFDLRWRLDANSPSVLSGGVGAAPNNVTLIRQ